MSMSCTGEKCSLKGILDELQGEIVSCTAHNCQNRTASVTNADRIRAMSDEELTEHEVRTTQDEMYYECSDGEIFAIYEDAIAYERALLKQPAGEDSHA